MSIPINVALVEEIVRLEKRITVLEFQLDQSRCEVHHKEEELKAMRHEMIDLKDSRDHYIALAGNNLAELRALQDRLANKDPYPDEFYNES